jgi:hypothetical protein
MLQAVGHQQHGGAATEHAPAPAPVERVQRLRDAGAAGPVVDHAHHLGHRVVRVLASQRPRDVRQPRAEHERLHAHVGRLRAGGDRVQEVQEHARVAAHAAGDVDQRHQRRRTGTPHAARKGDDLATAARAVAQQCAQVDARAGRRRPLAAGDDRREQRRQLPEHAARSVPLGGGHRIEVRLAQRLALGPTHLRIDLDALALRRRLGLALRLEQRLGQASVLRRRRRRSTLLLADLRQQHAHHLPEQVRVLPEDVERLVEQCAMLGAIDQAAMQGGVEVTARGQPGDLQRIERQQHAVGADGHTRRAQDASEVHDVVGEVQFSSRVTRRFASRAQDSPACAGIRLRAPLRSGRALRPCTGFPAARE